ncbi:HvfA family oxazolone/thioamide-modified RiPP metallophore [Lysobacter capsici]|uniref:HvfA family oxazolone/thioamide-modified RiPP metallophore n=1 Tax=Lysobacter capsici TaxID=435897 RepID=UPI00398CB4E4
MSKQIKKPLALALGATLIGGLSLSASAFAMSDLSQGYLLGAQQAPPAAEKAADAKAAADTAKTAEGSCGADKKAKEGSCGADKKKAAEGKCGEGKCGGEKKADAAKPVKTGEAAAKKAGEGKCGEGKCGGSV